MKKRNRSLRGRGWQAKRALPNLFAKRDPRKRKPFSFEPLEARFAFSATPLNFEPTNVANEAPEAVGAEVLRELQWSLMQAAATNGVDLTAYALPTDPYFPNPLTIDLSDPTQGGGQWHLLNIGQQVGNPDYQFIFGVPGEDINVVPAWNLGYTGEGVLVAVLDDGVQMTHPDLHANIATHLAFNAFNGTGNGNPMLIIPSHGTAVAGLLGADDNGEGGVGVAPDVTIVPIRMLGNDNVTFGTDPVVNAFRYALMIGVDVTNNSWGPGAERTFVTLSQQTLDVLRDSAIFGRDGLGMINVFASGNSAELFDSATYDPFLSRYTIGVTGVDHDGAYTNIDGTITDYPEVGPNVLVAAPTGSNGTNNQIANDTGLGSGLWTTDLVGANGYNAPADPITGIDDDRDFHPDVDYTTRFNGTSASAPLVSGVIALMLDANPNLTLRDVQEILVRSARQNAQFDFPSSGGGTPGAGRTAEFTTWQFNHMIPFRDPDSWPTSSPFDSIYDPIADPTLTDFPRTTFQWPASPATGNDIGRTNGHYELMPWEFANGAGYTVSQGYGAFGESIGFAHGTVDAELAVIMARDWHTLKQNMPPMTQRTFTSFSQGAFDVLPAERGNDASGNILVPGGIVGPGADGGFIDFWNEYFADPPAPFDPANADSWPDNTRGLSYMDFTVPLNQQMNVEWVEVKVTFTGSSEAINYLKLNMTSPNGAQSELNHYYAGIGGVSLQYGSEPATGWIVAGLPAMSPEGTFTYTFSTNRNWGESTNSAVIIDPLTGEPVAGSPDFSTGAPLPIFRDWELHMENWGPDRVEINDVEIVWHGKPIQGGQIDQEWEAFDAAWNIPVAQRIQGFVGLDVDNDDEFSGIDPTRDNEWNNGYIQEYFDFDPSFHRQSELQRRVLDDFQDNNNNGIFDEGDVREMEPYLANVLVEAFEFTVVNGVDVVADDPIAQFLTGADGNYYFDLLPGNYVIRVSDRNDIPATAIDDPNTAAGYRQHYKDEWRITADWFYAPDRDAGIDVNGDTVADIPGEIFYDAVSQAPVAFRFDPTQPRIPAAVKDLNFLMKPQVSPAQNIVVNGTVYADVNENGAVDIFDSPAGGMRVYVDSIRNNQFDPGEQFVLSNPDGTYSLTVDASTQQVVVIGVDLEPGWAPSIVGGDTQAVLAGPGDVINNLNFFLNPPDDSSGTGLSNITGFVFNDLDGDGVRDPNEHGLSNVTVFIDADMNGMLDAGETSAVTSASGGYFFANVAPGTHRIDVVIADEGTPDAAAILTTPVIGYHDVNVIAGQTRTGVVFGIDSLLDNDFGDLPASYNTAGNPSHRVVPHFRLGATVDGDLPSQAVGGDDASDDGVEIVSNGGVLKPGVNEIVVQTFGVGGFLTGWIDWDGDGAFQADERLVFVDKATGKVLGTEADLPPSGLDGIHLLVTANADITAGPIGARFRWGELGLNSFSNSFIGEVEDYFLPSTAVVVVPPAPGDFNEDGGVNAADYVLFRKMLGTGGSLPNSTNPSGPVVPQDATLWQTHFGEAAGSGGGGGAAFLEQTETSAPSGGATSVVALGGSLQTGPSDSGAAIKNGAPAVVSATPVFAPALVNLSVDVSSIGSLASINRVLSDASVSGVQANTEILLLLDQAIEELDDRDDEAPLADRSGDESEYSDLALAAAFDDTSAWWSM